MRWGEYVRRIIGNDRQIDVAQKTGIDQTTISRWLAEEREGVTRRISSQSVAAFARGYGVSTLEAFVAAGFLTEQEAGVRPRRLPPLQQATKDELIAELDRRLSS